MSPFAESTAAHKFCRACHYDTSKTDSNEIYSWFSAPAGCKKRRLAAPRLRLYAELKKVLATLRLRVSTGEKLTSKSIDAEMHKVYLILGTYTFLTMCI